MLSLGQNILEGQVAVVVLSVCVLVCVSVCVPMPCEPGYEARVELITIDPRSNMSWAITMKQKHHNYSNINHSIMLVLCT